MQDTWIKLYRKLLDNPVFDNPAVLKVWLWALLKANHRETAIVVGYQTITLNPGEFLFGRQTAAEKLKMSPSTVWRCMTMLVQLGNLDIKSTNKFSIVKINNWIVYQEPGQQMDNKRKTKGQQMDTDNNDKNVKNDKNISNEIEQSSSYGRSDINDCIAFLKDQLGATPDGTQQRNRIFCKHLINKMKKDYPDKDPVIQIKALIEFGRKDSFHGKNITSFEYLYKNAQKIIESVKTQRSQAKNIIINDPNV